MKINTNIGMRKSSKITFSKFRGLDTLTPSVDVKPIHATEMQNLITRDGANHKRYGWKTHTRIRHDSKFLSIKGIFNFTIFLEDFILAYAGKKFWLINDNGEYDYINNKSIEPITHKVSNELEEKIIDETLFVDEECKCFVNGDKVYFIGCGDYLVFSKWSNGNFELRRVVGNEDVYIPTTTENIGSEESGTHLTRITAEERNILSPYTYNTLFGVNELPVDSKLNYYLDSTNFTDVEVTIEKGNEKIVVLKSNKDTELGKYGVGENIGNIQFDFHYDAEYEKEGSIYQEKVGDAWLKKCVVRNDFPKRIDLIKTSGGGTLAIKNKFTLSKGEYLNIQNVEVFFTYYSKLSCDVVYIDSNGNEVILSSVADVKISNTIVSSSVSDNKVSINIQTFANYGSFSFDLKKYELIIEEILQGEYFGDGSGEKIIAITGGGYSGLAYPSDGKLVLNAVESDANAYMPLVADVPNIKVKIERSIDNTIITSSNKGCEFGTEGVPDRLFLVDASGNLVRWSKDDDFTYFGEKSWCACGTADKKITGMDRLNDSTLLVVKEYSPREPALFVIKGGLSAKETEGGSVDYLALFSARGYQVGMGAVGEVINFNGECLMTAKDGFYAVAVGNNIAIDSRYLYQRSRQISNTLEKFDLSKAKSISFNGKCFVSVGNDCFIADSKYMVTFAEGQSANYEWWRWTNISVSVWGIVNNELWFGTEDGQLCYFTKNFIDEKVTGVYRGLISYKMDNDNIVGFILNHDIDVEVNDIFVPTCNLYGGINVKCECENGITKLYLPLNSISNQEVIYIDGVGYELTKNDLYCSINYETDKTELLIYKNYINQELIVTNTELFTLKDKNSNYPLWSKVTSNGGLNPSDTEFKAKIINRKPVIAKWISGATDLGTRNYSKSLDFIAITGEKDLANRFRYGLITRSNNKEYALLRANNDLDFSKLDLETVSLDSQFASTYVKRLNMRNINFLMFYFVSDSTEDIALNSVQIEFKINKRNIGVR